MRLWSENRSSWKSRPLVWLSVCPHVNSIFAARFNRMHDKLVEYLQRITSIFSIFYTHHLCMSVLIKYLHFLSVYRLDFFKLPKRIIFYHCILSFTPSLQFPEFTLCSESQAVHEWWKTKPEITYNERLCKHRISLLYFYLYFIPPHRISLLFFYLYLYLYFTFIIVYLF